MKIYVVINTDSDTYDRDKEDIIGIFATEEEAIEYVQNECPLDMLEVFEHDLREGKPVVNEGQYMRVTSFAKRNKLIVLMR